MKIAGSERQCRVLVFPGGSEIALEIHRALAHSVHVALFGATSVDSDPGRYAFQSYYTSLPFVDSPDFLPTVGSLVEAERIDVLFPAHDSVGLRLAGARDALPCAVAVASHATCKVARDKALTYEALQGVMATPRVYDPVAKDLPFPLFLKPRVGQGSKGTVRVETDQELAFYLERDPTLLVLEYLPGAEYTVDCFTDKSGVLRFVGARSRDRILNGIAVDTRPTAPGPFEALARQLNARFELRGAWFFQVKENAAGELALLEFSPRVSGSMGLYRNLGVNFPLLTVFDAMDNEVEILAQTFGIRMDRALQPRFNVDLDYEAVYIDFDDTLVIDGQVNTEAMAFLYQCRNQGKSLHLLSKHAGDLASILAQYRLSGLFDTIDHLQPEQAKSALIDNPKAIFIDDSFAERKAVAAACGIATFAVDALGCLMDYRC